MSIAYRCVFLVAFMPYFWVALAKWKRGYDNNAPRPQLEALQGWRQRANWAQLNAFEAFPPFAAAVIIAHYYQVPQDRIDTLAMVFVAARVVHGVLYIADKASLRSAVWFVGLGCVIGLFMSAGRM